MKEKKEYCWSKRLIYIRETSVIEGGWNSKLAICGNRDLQIVFHNDTDNSETFHSPIQAEESALERAIKWIDELQNEIYKVQN